MDTFVIYGVKTTCFLVCAFLALAVVFAVRCSLRGENDMDDGHNPVPGSACWFVVKMGLGAILAFVLCVALLLFYVWMISDDVDKGVDALIEQEQRQQQTRDGR